MAFWRQEDPVLDERRRVVMGGMWQHQRDWWQLPNFIRMLVGGYGSGKTITLAKWIIAASLHNAPAWGATVSPTYRLARRTIIPTIRTLLNGKATLRKDLSFKFNKGDSAFTIKLDQRPDATILCMSGEDPDALKGPNLGPVVIDEPFIQDQAVFEQMVARARDPVSKFIAIGLGGTPEQLNWGYELVHGELAPKYDVGVVTADTRANKALSPEYAERMLKGYDPQAAEAYVMGRFVNLSTGRVFYAFDPARNVKPQSKTDAAVHFVGMDFNVNPMAFVVGWHRGDTAHIYAEHELPNSDTEYAASLIREKYPQVRIAFPDPTGRRRQTNAPGGMSDFKWLQKAGFVTLAPIEPWPRRDSFNSVNRMYANGKLTIDPSCKKLIHYLQQHTHELAKKQEAMTHLLDAHRYPITYLFPAYRHASATTTISGT